MKVNIIGTGIMIPGFKGVSAPLMNVDIPIDHVKRLLNYSELKVYGIDCGLITKANVDKAFELDAKNIAKIIAKNAEVKEPIKPTSKKKSKKVVEPEVAEPVVEEIAPVTEEAPVVEEPVVEETIVVPEMTEEDATVNAPCEDVVEVAEEVDVVEEEVKETPVTTYSSRRNKKNRK